MGLEDGEKPSWSGKKQALADRLNVSVRRGSPGSLQVSFTGKYAREQSPWLTGKTEVKQVFGGADRDFTLLDLQVETGSKQMGSRSSGGRAGLNIDMAGAQTLQLTRLDPGE